MSDPVLIVGAGPTGLAAALELSRLGIPVRLIDKREAPATTSRAIGIQARTLELMHQRGLAEEMIALGNKAPLGSIYGGGKRLVHLDFSHVDSPYPYMLFLSQAETERILRKALAQRGIEPEWRTALVGIAQDALAGIAQDALAHDPAPVTAVVDGPGGLERLAAPWLIAAEGAHSLTRTTLDLQFQGKTLNEHYALGDLHLDGPLATNEFHIFSSEHGFLALFPLGPSHFRMIASHPLGDPAGKAPPSEAELQRLYDQRSHIPARLHDTGWTSWFRINSRMVPRLKIGRLLLGGDAAHIHSPAGAQGMNTGMQDMINLGWKLALVIRGQAPPELLDTYEHDRLPVMHDVLFQTESITEIMGSENPLVRALINHVGPWVAGSGFVQAQATNRMAQVSLGYRTSPLSRQAGHGGELRAGDRLPPHLRVRHRATGEWRDGTLGDLLDPSGFVLLIAQTSESDAVDPAVLAAIAGASVSIPAIAIAAPSSGPEPYRHVLGGGGGVWLVRPDGYVAVIAGTPLASEALGDFLRDWLAPESAAPG